VCGTGHPTRGEPVSYRPYSPYRFVHDQSGQGIVFAAATLILLIGFVALVLNLGRVIERRTRMQLAADAAAYSGASVQADTLSAIGWINSLMAQVHYNALKYAVDLNVAGVQAELERRREGEISAATAQTLRDAYTRANTELPRAKTWMVNLSRIESCLAILSARFTQEEMIAVASKAGAERFSFYPSLRMFPSPSNVKSYSIERLGNGWHIVNLLGGTGEELLVYMVGNEWHIEHSADGMTLKSIVITQVNEDHWMIQFYDSSSGGATQTIHLLRNGTLGWTVWDGKTEIQFEPADMDEDGENEGVRVTINGESAVLQLGPDGNLYIWDNILQEYVPHGSDEITIGGTTIKVNVSNSIHFDGGSIHIGDPCTVTIGNAHIVLSDPPVISTGIDPVRITIYGFDPEGFGISIGGYSLGLADADGVWRKYYDSHEELYWRHRLLQPDPDVDFWQYDYQWLGALLQYEMNDERYLDHVFGDRGFEDRPDWTRWFDAMQGAPVRGPVPNDAFDEITRDEDGSTYQRIKDGWMAALDPDTTDYYYRTVYPCGNPLCDGAGGWWVDRDSGREWVICPSCRGRDWNQDGRTDIRVFPTDVVGNLRLMEAAGESDKTKWNDRLQARIFRTGNDEVRAYPPLVLADEFFKYGLNFGAWREKDTLMLFPAGRQPDWGVVALSSARIGVRDDDTADGRRYDFDTREDRQFWCADSPWNLYTGDIIARLYPTRYQVKEYDLDRDMIEAEIVEPIMESPTSYLWDALLRARQINNTLTWVDAYDGRGDPRVSSALRNMHNRAGEDFDYGHSDIDDVVEH
jgi:Flp pilus assembly protein TadG